MIICKSAAAKCTETGTIERERERERKKEKGLCCVVL